MSLLSSTLPAEVTPAIMGMAVIILLQLSQFFFAWRKDMRGTESVRKEDLTTLRIQIMEEIEELSDDVKDLRHAMEKSRETQNLSAHNCRSEMHSRINSIALQTSALVEGMDTAKQSMAAMNLKLDAMRISPAYRKTPS